MPRKTRDWLVAGSIAGIVFLGAIVILWRMSAADPSRPLARSAPATAAQKQGPARAAKKPEPSKADIRQATEEIVRNHLKAAKTAEFLKDSDVGKVFGDRWEVKGQFDSQNTYGVFQRHSYEAKIDVDAEAGDVTLSTLFVDGELWYADESTKKLMADSGNMFEGTPEQEQAWSSAASRAQSIVRYWLKGAATFSGHARNGGPQVIESDGKWVVMGKVFTREGQEHRFKVRLTKPGKEVVSCEIDGVEYGPAPKQPQ
jgi:hypothetical protein